MCSSDLKVSIISTIQTTINSLKTAAEKQNIENVDIAVFDKYENIVSFFKYEMPEIKIIDFGDPNIDAEACVKVIKDDPWLLFGRIIAITNDRQEKAKLEQIKEPNFLFVCTRKDFEKNTEQIIKILNQHQHFLFNRGMHQRADSLDRKSVV